MTTSSHALKENLNIFTIDFYFVATVYFHCVHSIIATVTRNYVSQPMNRCYAEHVNYYSMLLLIISERKTRCILYNLAWRRRWGKFSRNSVARSRSDPMTNFLNQRNSIATTESPEALSKFYASLWKVIKVIMTRAKQKTQQKHHGNGINYEWHNICCWNGSSASKGSLLYFRAHWK